MVLPLPLKSSFSLPHASCHNGFDNNWRKSIHVFRFLCCTHSSQNSNCHNQFNTKSLNFTKRYRKTLNWYCLITGAWIYYMHVACISETTFHIDLLLSCWYLKIWSENLNISWSFVETWGELFYLCYSKVFRGKATSAGILSTTSSSFQGREMSYKALKHLNLLF